MTEEELNLDKNKFFLDKAFTLIADKEKIMTLIIQLMVALLIISSFSNNFIEDNGVIKNIIIFLLILIPIMLGDYTLRLSSGLNDLTKVLKDNSTKTKNFLTKIIDGSVYGYVSIATIVLDFIAWIIAEQRAWFIVIFFVQVAMIGCVFWRTHIRKE